MRIQHNILAMNAYRNYTNNTSALAKNLEKLSSGYKINRAGDDAAGLAISEKMRAQITGLEAAQKNVKDGVSLVKTAEGALSEVHDMLNRMVYLANQSANGTYDDTTDRANLQKELDQLRAEINRIADSANFNGIQLLDGTMSTTATAGMTSSINSSLLPDISKTGLVSGGTVLHRNPTGRTGGTEISIDFHDYTFSNATADGDYTLTIGSSDGAITLTFAGVATAAASNLSGAVTADKLLADLVKGGGSNFKLKGIQVGGQTASFAVSGSTVKITGTTYGDITMSIGKGGDNRLTFKQTSVPDGDKVQEWTPMGNSGISAFDPKTSKSAAAGSPGDWVRDISRSGPVVNVTITNKTTTIDLGAAQVQPSSLTGTVATFAASYAVATATGFDAAQGIASFAAAGASLGAGCSINATGIQSILTGVNKSAEGNKINLYYDSGQWKLAATGGKTINVELQVHSDGGKIQIVSTGAGPTVLATLALSFSQKFGQNNEGTAAVIAAMATKYAGAGSALTIATAASNNGTLSKVRVKADLDDNVFTRRAASASINQKGLKDFDAAKMSAALSSILGDLDANTPHTVKLYYDASSSNWKLSVGSQSITVNLHVKSNGTIIEASDGANHVLFKLQLTSTGSYADAKGSATLLKDMESKFTAGHELTIGTFTKNAAKTDVTASVDSFASAGVWASVVSDLTESGNTNLGASPYTVTLATDSGDWKVRIGNATLAADVSYANGTLTIATSAGGAVLAKIKLSGSFGSLANAEDKLKAYFGNDGMAIGTYTAPTGGGKYTVKVNDTSNLDLQNFIRQNTASAAMASVAVSLTVDAGGNWKLKVGNSSYAVTAAIAADPAQTAGSVTLKILASAGGSELFTIKLTGTGLAANASLGSIASIIAQAQNGVEVGTYSYAKGTADPDGGRVSADDRAALADAIGTMTGADAINEMLAAGLQQSGDPTTVPQGEITLPTVSNVNGFDWTAASNVTVSKGSLTAALTSGGDAITITVDGLGVISVNLSDVIDGMDDEGGNLTMGDIRDEILRKLQEAANAKTADQLRGSTGEYWVVSDLKFVDNAGNPMRNQGVNISYKLTKIINPKDSDENTVPGSGLKSYQLNIDAADYALVDGGERLASTWFDLSDVKDNIADGNSITIGTQTYVFTNNSANIQKTDEAGNKYVFIGSTPNMETAAYYLQLAAKDNTLYTVGWNGKDRITLTEKRLDEPTRTSAFTTASGGSTLTTKEAIANSIKFNTGKKPAGKGLTLQIGDTSDSYNQLIVSIEDCHTSSLGIADIDISTQEGAQEAVDRIKDAINYISNVRGTLGATQNRLEHTANNLSVMAENIQDAESTIRDTDVAEEMMSYVKNNILIQSAQAMLAQANQIPQGVLQLLG